MTRDLSLTDRRRISRRPQRSGFSVLSTIVESESEESSTTLVENIDMQVTRTIRVIFDRIILRAGEESAVDTCNWLAALMRRRDCVSDETVMMLKTALRDQAMKSFEQTWGPVCCTALDIDWIPLTHKQRSAFWWLVEQHAHQEDFFGIAVPTEMGWNNAAWSALTCFPPFYAVPRGRSKSKPLGRTRYGAPAENLAIFVGTLFACDIIRSADLARCIKLLLAAIETPVARVSARCIFELIQRAGDRASENEILMQQVSDIYKWLMQADIVKTDDELQSLLDVSLSNSLFGRL